MSTQIAFTTDKKLKEQVMKKSKKEGLTLKGILNQCMQAYANGEISIGVKQEKREIIVTSTMENAYTQAMKDLKEGKNIYSMNDLEELMRKRGITV